jgi:hypothetical protein
MVENRDFPKFEWKEIKTSKVKTYHLDEDPEIIYLITIRDNEYMIVHEDAFDLNTGKVEFMNAKEVKDNYNIDTGVEVDDHLSKFYRKDKQNRFECDESIRKHNEDLLSEIAYEKSDFEDLIDGSFINGKIEWVDNPNFTPIPNPRFFGVFTLIDNKRLNIGDPSLDFLGFFYVEVKGFDKCLKIPVTNI